MTALASSPPRLNPYVGPRPFERGERLYGRDREAARLRDLLIAERIVLLYSPSGAGKTSLIRASLVPELEREGFRVRPEIRVATALAPVDGSSRPGNRYLMSTLLCLEQGQPAERRHDLDELAGMGLGDYLDQRDGDHDGEVLIFDQFEELLTADVTDRDAKSAFLTELGTALRDRRRWALFAMREDCVAGLDPYLRLLPTRLRATFRLDLLGEVAARMAIQGPAREAGVDFSDAAARKLADNLRRVRVRRPGGSVKALGPYIEPVQLQVVCERLWERLGERLRVTESDVTEVGDVESALASYYADRVGAIATETGADERAIRTWFDRALITEQGLRGQVLAGPLDGAPEDERVLGLLEDAHLVRTDTRGGAQWFELAHDRLIEPVRTSNREWFDANLQPFQRQALLWQDEYQPARLLLTGDALAEADRWVEEHPGQVKPVERTFLATSRRAHDELQRKQRSAQRIRRLAIATSILTVVSVLALIWARYKGLEVRSQGLAWEAMGLLDTDPATALDRAVEALSWSWVSPRQARTALTSALAQSHVRAILKEHTGSVRSVDFSPDGRLVVTVGTDGTARTWNATTGERLAVLGDHVLILTARFSPDGSRVVVTASADKTARVWDAKTGREQTVLRGHEGAVVSAQWSRDGARVVTASADKTARVWDAKTGREQAVLRGHEGLVVSAQWSRDGARVVTASADDTARVWDVETGSELAKLPVPKGAGSANAVFLDGTHVLAAGADAAYLWEWGANRTPIELSGGKPEFSPDGRYVLTVDGQTVRVWDTRSGMSVVKLKGHEDLVTVARFSWDNAHIVSGSEDGTVRIWDVTTGATLVELRGHQDRVNDVAFSPNQPDPTRPAVVTASADGTARVWNPSIGRVLHGPTAGLSRASFSADGTLVVDAGADGVARVWRADTGEQLAELHADPQPLGSAAFSPDGRYIATGGSDGIVRVWEWRTKAPVAQVHVGGYVRAVVFDPLGRFVAIAENAFTENASVWEWATGKSLPLDGHRHAVTNAAFSSDGSRLVTVSLDQTARVWDAVTGKELRQLGPYQRPIYNADFSPDGRFIVIASAGKAARVWDAATGKELARLKGHKRGLKDAAFSGDGNYIVTGADDGMIGVWKASTGDLLALLQTPSASVTSVQFSPGRDSHTILTVSQDRTVRIYDCEICVPLRDLRNLAKDRQRYVTGRASAP
ncbi:MAG: NACHT and WD repeat domain-containing protein [Egibacteraceae bacterium]